MPNYHIMQSGSPHARYSIIHIQNNITQVEHIALEYNWNLAAKVAKNYGREDWFQWIKTGSVI